MMVDLLRWARVETLLTAWRAGLWTPPDRRILDGVILPHYARTAAFERALFVGVKAYNVRSRGLFAGRTYATIDPEASLAAYGGTPHFVAGLQDLSRHVEPASFDVIVVNGVLGHGLDAEPDVERAIGACHRALREGGELVLGVNEDTASAVDLSAVEAMRGFVPVTFAPLGVSVHVVRTPLRELTHTFRFYRRTASAA